MTGTMPPASPPSPSTASTRYGAVVDGGIVDLSARFGKDYPTLREVDRRRRADEARATDAAKPFAGLCAGRDHLAAADPGAGKDHLHRRQLSRPQRRIQGRPGRAEISQHVHAHAALLCRPRDAAGAAARLDAARLRGRSGAGDRQGRPAHRRERGAGSHRRGRRCATKAPSATGSATPNSTSRRARISIPPAASARGSCPTPTRSRDRRHPADHAGQRRDCGRTTAPAG